MPPLAAEFYNQDVCRARLSAVADDNPVIVAKYASMMQAKFAQSILESAGIPSYLADENALRCAGEICPLEGARLYVPASDEEDAKAVLQDASLLDNSQ